MPVDVGKFTTEVTAVDGDLPLSSAQLESLVQAVVRRLEERRRAAESGREATSIRRSAAPPSPLDR
jgi:hypothetical protein